MTRTASLKTLSGKAIFPIGIGTWGIGGGWEPEYGHEAEGAAGIRYSISRGQNHIDCGEIYGKGHTEEVIGQAVKGLKREDLFIGDKLWETSVGNGQVRPAVKRMLKKLGTDYLDLLYIHKPWQDWPWREAIPQISDLIDEGVVRGFGASNFNVAKLKETTALSKHPILVNQLHYNILNKQEASDQMQQFCKANQIQIIAYKPLERGTVIEHETVKQIAKAHKATASQIALAWLIHHKAWPIPMATEKVYVDQNIAAAQIQLTAAEIKLLNGII